MRDLAIAHYVGGGYWADLYFASFRVANVLRRLVGEGGLYAAYTPVYSALLAKDAQSAREFAHAYVGKLYLTLIVILSLCLVFIEPITTFLLFGYADDPEKLNWAIKLTAILLPFLAFVVLGAWAQATLQAHGRFFLSSLSPIFASLAVILYLVSAHDGTMEPSYLLIGLAWATTVGGLLQYVMLLPTLMATIGYHGFSCLWKGHPELKKSFKLFLPYMTTFSVDQVNSMVDVFFGSFAGPGAISALYNTSRLIQLPLGLVGVGSLVTTLPSFSKMAATADKEKMLEALRKQRRTVLLLCVPAALALAFGAPWIVKLLYFHGRFDESAFELTKRTLIAASPSLLFYSLQKLYLSVFYANHDTRSPVLISLTQLAVAAGTAALLVGRLGPVGIALGGTFASLSGFLVMLALIKRNRYLVV